MSALDQALLFATTFVAGLLNATVGGGGLLQLPMLMLLVPAAPLASLIGTTKLVGWPGLVGATATYSRKLKPKWPLILRAALMEVPFAVIGARVATLLNPAYARPIIIAILAIMALYVLLTPAFGERVTGPERLAGPLPWVTGAGIGFYEGFLGSGSGTMLIVVFVTLCRVEIIDAAVASAFVTLAGVTAAMITFVLAKSVLVVLALKMMVFNVAGSLLGARLVMLKGNTLLRRMLGAVLLLLIVKMAIG